MALVLNFLRVIEAVTVVKTKVTTTVILGITRQEAPLASAIPVLRHPGIPVGEHHGLIN